MSSRRRALLVLTIALLAAGAAWLASVVIGGSRFSLTASEAGGAFRVATDLPAATCSKELGGGFPWVRFSCEPHEREPGAAGRERAPGAASGGP